MREENEIQTISRQRNLVVIQRNPTSGSGRGRRQVYRLLCELRRVGFEVRLYHDRNRFSHFVHRPEVADRLRCLVAAGGDGTISSVVQRHPEHPIAVLPLGTENLVSKHLGLNSNAVELATVIQEGRFLSFDTGLANSFRFLLMASAGLDAEIVRLLALRRSGNISHLSYFWPIFTAFRKYRFPELQVLNAQGDLIATGSHVLVSNMPEYGMKIPFCPDANPHDGLLDVRIFQPSGMFRTAAHLIRTRLGFKDSARQLVRFQAPMVTLKSNDFAAPVQADGDPCGTGTVIFRVADEKMRLLVPKDFRVRHPE